MNLDEELKLSYYREVADINEEHGVTLVQHTETGDFFVKKTLTIYNMDVIRRLRLQSPKDMPKILEAVEHDGKVTLIEEYIHGESLERTITERHRLSEKEAADIVCQLCDIVKQLHDMQPAVIHRDIKPSNILITPDGRVKLLDINAARFATDAPEDTVLMGTAGYAAPEQFGFSSTSPSADIYAIGVVLNRMLTGNLPKYGMPENRGMRMIVEKCTHLDPKDRYRSTKQLKHAVSGMNEPESRTSDIPDWMKYLPPGFRNRKPLMHAVSTLLYAFVIDICFSFTAKNTTPRQLFIEHVFVFLAFMANIFFSGNYLGIQEKWFLTRSQSKGRRIPGIVVTDILITFFLIITMLIVET